MPFPDVLPPEIWHHIVSIASIDRSHLVPWLSIAPYTCAKGMHDAAFAKLFDSLVISASREEDWLLAALKLSRYAREEKLRAAVQRVVGYWNPGVALQHNEKESIYELRRRKRSVNMLEDLICEILEKLENIQHLEWSTGFHNYPIGDKIFQCLEIHFPSVTSLVLSGATFHDPLDLRLATSLSVLQLRHMQLTSTSSSPPIILSKNLSHFFLFDVYTRDESNPWWSNETPPLVDPNLPPSHVLAALDLSHIRTINFGDVDLSELDCSHILPPAPSPTSTGGQLTTLRLLKVGRTILTALSHCGPFSRLHTLSIAMIAKDVLSVAYAEDAIHSISTFIKQQKGLEQLSIDLADMYTIDVEEFEDEDTDAYEQALTMAYFRDALAGLKSLRRFLLGTYNFGVYYGVQYPALDEAFARSLPALQTFVVNCVLMNEHEFDEVAQAFNRYPSLRVVGFTPCIPKERSTEARDMSNDFSLALKNHAPRVEYCSVYRERWRLKGSEREEVTLFDADFREVFGDIRFFV